MSIDNERGTALIEAVTAALTMAGLIVGGLTLCYVAFARVWLERSAYEAAICLSTSAGVTDCRQQFMRATQTALPLGSVSELDLKRSISSAEVSVRFKLLGREVVRLRDRRTLPLLPGPTS